MENNYIPIWQYAKEQNTSVQNVYRWIREGKIKDVKKVEVTKTKLFINRKANKK